ncbi:hypothetical protein ZEAMMB73_Zm00001d040937 [Zea mays]|uniref:Uncharacterized protein n=1 Tax=Zea mays TaxID=4577 RepID=A0A1D6MTJ5_MAIZE|nr:hypothetical protein ZEAMMB73_Zm00001d040937 [Zea mays]
MNQHMHQLFFSNFCPEEPELLLMHHPQLATGKMLLEPFDSRRNNLQTENTLIKILLCCVWPPPKLPS